MDERLQALAVEAGIFDGVPLAYEPNLEAFAKLIAKDCAESLHAVGPTQEDYDGDDYESAEIADCVIGQCMSAIRSRYGVE